ncbi:MAG: hydantoinase B/oxoprolinase family protein [Parvibaculaceae bacterium]
MSKPAHIDPITLEVIKNALAATADEMALVVMRSAYSAVVRDSMDYSTAIADREGEIIAQGLTLAVQLGSFPDCLKLVVQKHRDTARPGDIFAFNDPYGSAGQHLPDIYVIKPIFADGGLVGWACTMAHHCDVGGIAPGSTAMHATEILQEGLCIPLLKLYEEGRPNETLFAILAKNSRQPRYLLGDIRAQVAACSAGERGYGDLVRRHGYDDLARYFHAMQDQAESLMRSIIRTIPEGVYSATDYIDGIGDDPRPVAITATIEVGNEQVRIDLAGSSPQVAAAINCPIAMVRSAAYCAIRCLSDIDIPNCQGYMRPIVIEAPPGSIVNPLYPAACAARGVVGYRVFDAIMGAFAKAAPGRVIAGGEGGPTLLSIGGSHRGQPFVLTEVMVGTWGARAELDGIEGISNPAANLSNQPIEIIETETPLEIVRYGFVPDSGGPGKQRGGLAFVREFRLRDGTAQFTLRSDRRKHRPYGVAGGRPGAPSANLVIRADGSREELPTMPMKVIELGAGDSFHHVSAGGGGYGDPAHRNRDAIMSDVIAGKVSVEAAKRDYGVEIEPPGRPLAGDTPLRREPHMEGIG